MDCSLASAAPAWSSRHGAKNKNNKRPPLPTQSSKFGPVGQEERERQHGREEKKLLFPSNNTCGKLVLPLRYTETYEK
jgi:hypothetical protein